MYQLSDPVTGDVFYVGKGSSKRAWSHIRSVKSNRPTGNARKDGKIREILDRGFEPTVTVLARYESEAAAIDHEAELIATMRGLTNILARGALGCLTVEEAQRRIDEREAKKTVKAFESYASLWSSFKNGVTFPNVPNGDALAQELRDFVMCAIKARAPNLQPN